MPSSGRNQGDFAIFSADLVSDIAGVRIPDQTRGIIVIMLGGFLSLQLLLVERASKGL